MSNRPCRITKAEIERVIRAAISGGLNPGRIEVEGAKIVIYVAGRMQAEQRSLLADWMAHNGEG